MGQKIHPFGFRLGITQTHRAVWFESKKYYPKLLKEDCAVRKCVYSILGSTGISKVNIYRKSNQLELEVCVSKTSSIYGRFEMECKRMKDVLKTIVDPKVCIRITLREVVFPEVDASLVAEFIAQQLEKRVAFRKVLRQALQKTQKVPPKGIKIQISGRLNGAEIARTEWVREGRVPLQTLRADIDYGTGKAFTTYGILGIKVWIFRENIFQEGAQVFK